MEKQVVVLISWDERKPTNMASFAHGVAEKMSINAATFPTPPVTPKDLDAAATRVELAYANRLNGPVAKTELQMADSGLDIMLHNLAAYVNSIANGDVATIQSAGFKASSNTRLPATNPATPNAAEIKGNASALHLE